MNVYAYVNGNTANFTDPLGTELVWQTYARANLLTYHLYWQEEKTQLSLTYWFVDPRYRTKGSAILQEHIGDITLDTSKVGTDIALFEQELYKLGRQLAAKDTARSMARIADSFFEQIPGSDFVAAVTGETLTGRETSRKMAVFWGVVSVAGGRLLRGVLGEADEVVEAAARNADEGVEAAATAGVRRLDEGVEAASNAERRLLAAPDCKPLPATVGPSTPGATVPRQAAFGGVVPVTSEEASFLRNARASFGDSSVFGTAKRFSGNIVIQRSDIPWSVENVRRMTTGNAPFVRNQVGEWEKLNLHHVGRDDGKLIEVLSSQNAYNPTTGGPLHIPGPGGPVRDPTLASSYWTDRLRDAVQAGLVPDGVLKETDRALKKAGL